MSALGSSQDRPLRRLPLVVHVAERQGQPVADAQFVAERVARANQIFAPYRVAFVPIRCLTLPAAHAELESRADRDALARYLERHVIDWFVVASLRDVDAPPQLRRGVHWHARQRPDAHYVIVSTLGGLDVLAHELGHYLGNPEHSQTVGNLMSYARDERLPFLDAAQIVRLERTLQRADLPPVAADVAAVSCGP